MALCSHSGDPVQGDEDAEGFAHPVDVDYAAVAGARRKDLRPLDEARVVDHERAVVALAREEIPDGLTVGARLLEDSIRGRRLDAVLAQLKPDHLHLATTEPYLGTNLLFQYANTFLQGLAVVRARQCQIDPILPIFLARGGRTTRSTSAESWVLAS